jgi:hypothetical protein
LQLLIELGLSLKAVLLTVKWGTFYGRGSLLPWCELEFAFRNSKNRGPILRVAIVVRSPNMISHNRRLVLQLVQGVLDFFPVRIRAGILEGLNGERTKSIAHASPVIWSHLICGLISFHEIEVCLGRISGEVVRNNEGIVC